VPTVPASQALTKARQQILEAQLSGKAEDLRPPMRPTPRRREDDSNHRNRGLRPRLRNSEAEPANENQGCLSLDGRAVHDASAGAADRPHWRWASEPAQTSRRWLRVRPLLGSRSVSCGAGPRAAEADSAEVAVAASSCPQRLAMLTSAFKLEKEQAQNRQDDHG
jgi:hypothetical protein